MDYWKSVILLSNTQHWKALTLFENLVNLPLAEVDSCGLDSQPFQWMLIISQCNFLKKGQNVSKQGISNITDFPLLTNIFSMFQTLKTIFPTTHMYGTCKTFWCFSWTNSITLGINNGSTQTLVRVQSLLITLQRMK